MGSVFFSLFLNTTICVGTGGVVGGEPFAVVSMFCAVFCVYRFWDSITEDEYEEEEKV